MLIKRNERRRELSLRLSPPMEKTSNLPPTIPVPVLVPDVMHRP